jgi:hypothetical protein
VARFIVEDALLPKPDRLNIPAAVEYRERVAIEQDSGAIIGQGR